MISERDVSARTADQKRIRAALLTPHAEETPLPVASRTQELDPGDILEVRDMAEVIARAEQIVAAPRSSRPLSRRSDTTDIFDALVSRRPTDDAIGPATPAPAAIISTFALAHAPVRPENVPAPVSIAPATLVLTVPVATEDDAYYAPGGRVRSLADATLDGYRPEPTLLVRAAARRLRFRWLVVAALLPVAALAGFAMIGRSEPAVAASSTTSTANVTATVAGPAATTNAKVAVAAAKPAAKPAGSARAAVPTFDVNSLPTAKAK